MMQSQRLLHRRLNGFTLVELIVVITILVILGTIAFLNLGSFSGSARDSARISDLTNISKGLDLVFIKNWRVPGVEVWTNAWVISLLASGSAVGYQWAIGSSILSTIKMGGDGKDPLDKKSYTYVVNSNNTRYQILGFTEEANNVALDSSVTINQSYAGYEVRYPISRGSALGVLLGNSGTTLNQPIQENYSPSTLTGVEIFSATGGQYKAILSSKTSLSGTWPVLWEIAGRLDANVGIYPGCDTPNIKLPNGQVWAACNVGASRMYQGESIMNCNLSTTDCNAELRYTIGSFFQWGRNEDATTLSTGATLADTGTLATATLGKFVIPDSAIYPYDWIAAPNENLWGWSGTTSVWGTFLTQWSPDAMRGPCAAWYHVPTQYEWWTSIQSINPSIVYSTGLQNDTSVVSLLKLPLAWCRNNSAGQYGSISAWYWTSSSIPPYAYIFRANATTVTPLSLTQRKPTGVSVRCLKN